MEHSTHLSYGVRIGVEKLDIEIINAEKVAAESRRRQPAGDRDQALAHCLVNSIDIARGCVLTAKGKLPTCFQILTRAMWEQLVLVCWINESEHNATKFTKHPHQEFERVTGKLTDKSMGYSGRKSRWKPKSYGEDKGIGHISERARTVGLEEDYDVVYSFLSMAAHGLNYGLDPQVQNVGIAAFIKNACKYMAIINLVCKNRIFEGRDTSADEFNAVLWQA